MMGVSQLGQFKRTLNVDVHDFVKRCGISIHYRNKYRVGYRIIDNDIHTAAGFLRLSNKLLNLLHITHVAGQRQGFNVVLIELLHYLVYRILFSAGNTT